MRYGNLVTNEKGLGELLQGAGMQKVVGEAVEKAKVAAEALAPVGPEGDPHRGRYKGSFSTDVRVEAAAPKGGVRAVGRLINSAEEALDVEYGQYGRAKHPRTAAHHVMTRAIDSMRG